MIEVISTLDESTSAAFANALIMFLIVEAFEKMAGSTFAKARATSTVGGVVVEAGGELDGDSAALDDVEVLVAEAVALLVADDEVVGLLEGNEGRADLLLVALFEG
jgi:hypothetical protein